MFALLFLPSIGQRLCKVKDILHCRIGFDEILGQIYWNHILEKAGNICFTKTTSLHQTASRWLLIRYRSPDSHSFFCKPWCFLNDTSMSFWRMNAWIYILSLYLVPETVTQIHECLPGWSSCSVSCDILVLFLSAFVNFYVNGVALSHVGESCHSISHDEWRAQLV